MWLPFTKVRQATREVPGRTLAIFDADPASLRAYKEQYSKLGFSVKAVLVAPETLQPLRMVDGSIHLDRLEGMIRQAERASEIAKSIAFASDEVQNPLFALNDPDDMPTSAEQQHEIHAQAVARVVAREAGNATYMKQVRDEGSLYPIDEIICTRDQLREFLQRNQPACVLSDSNMRDTALVTGEAVMGEVQRVLGQRAVKVMHTHGMKDDKNPRHVILGPDGNGKSVSARTWRDQLGESVDSFLTVPKVEVADLHPPAFHAFKKMLKGCEARPWGQQGACLTRCGAL